MFDPVVMYSETIKLFRPAGRQADALHLVLHDGKKRRLVCIKRVERHRVAKFNTNGKVQSESTHIAAVMPEKDLRRCGCRS